MSIHQVFDQLNESRSLLEASSGVDGYHVNQLVVSKIDDEVCRELHSLRPFGNFSRRTIVGDSRVISYKVGADMKGWNGETRRGFISHHSQVVVRPYATDEMTMPLEVGVELSSDDGNRGEFVVSVSAPLVKARRLTVKGRFRWDSIESDARKFIKAFGPAAEKWWSDKVRDSVHVYAVNHALNVEESGEVSESFKDDEGMFTNRKDFDLFFGQRIVENIQKHCRLSFNDKPNKIFCDKVSKPVVLTDTLTGTTARVLHDGTYIVAFGCSIYEGWGNDKHNVGNVEVHVGIHQTDDGFQLALLANGRVGNKNKLNLPQYSEKGRWGQYGPVSRKFNNTAMKKLDDFFFGEIVTEVVTSGFVSNLR